MTRTVFQLEEPFTRKLWKKLRDNQVPIVCPDRYSELPDVISEVNVALRKYEYLPTTGHGFIGIQKGSGVARFLPILSDVDLSVYYHICFFLSDHILKRTPRIFGGWHQTPESMKAVTEVEESAEALANGFIQDYFSDPFSSVLWLKEWNQFTDLISELTSMTEIGNYVVQTDIANFYDSIEFPALFRRLRRDAAGYEHYIEALEIFLGYWNRRQFGYAASIKGVPQEVISDASRILSHYYLQRFDEEFEKFCAANDFVYVRWADDILIFGKSKKALQRATHRASRLLMSDGLNLNAAKTKIFARREFAKYRGVDVLAAVSSRNQAAFNREIRRVQKRYDKDEDQRIDTIFKASITFVRRLGRRAKVYERNFVLQLADDNDDLVASLNARQLLNLIAIADDPPRYFEKCLGRVVAKPFAGPRATFLHMMRKHRSELVSLGLNRKSLDRAVSTIERESEDSEIICGICVPATQRVYR